MVLKVSEIVNNFSNLNDWYIVKFSRSSKRGIDIYLSSKNNKIHGIVNFQEGCDTIYQLHLTYRDIFNIESKTHIRMKSLQNIVKFLEDINIHKKIIFWI